MKLAIGIMVVAGYVIIAQIVGLVRSAYNFENKYSYSWQLADKSSTIEAKANHMEKFVNNLSSNRDEFSNYNAIWLRTPNNNFDKNLEALVTLKNRLNEIKKMDATSFQYNTAIQQITAQEQGEAHSLIREIQGCYDLNNYWYVWDWVGVVIFVVMIIFAVVAGICISCETESY